MHYEKWRVKSMQVSIEYKETVGQTPFYALQVAKY